jgi:superoxide dismutase, Fe-Mn family
VARPLSFVLFTDPGALEPPISGKIMELHHKGHHSACVTGYNTAIEKLQEAQHANDIAAQIALKPLIKFNGGGHLNRTPVEFQTGFGIYR